MREDKEMLRMTALKGREYPSMCTNNCFNNLLNDFKYKKGTLHTYLKKIIIIYFKLIEMLACDKMLKRRALILTISQSVKNIILFS